MQRSRMARAFALSLVLVVLTGGVADAQIQLEPVVVEAAEQYTPFANDTYVVYSQWSPRRPNRFTAFARPLAGGAPIRLNEAGTNGEAGGFDPGTNQVIYTQWTRQEAATLYFYDLDTGQRTEVPGVNSAAGSWVPLISSTFITFLRDRFRQGVWYTDLLVFERATGQTRTIRTWKEPVFGFPGSVGDRYVAYTLCTKRNCFAHLYDWETDTQRRIPTVNRRPQYAPVVDETNGVVYVVRSGDRCGRRVGIWRQPLDLSSGATKLFGLPRGIDTGWISSVTPNGATGQTDLYFERWECAGETGDIYVARGVDAEPTP